MNEHFEHLLDAFLDRELSSQKNSQVERHLLTCSACRTALVKRQKLSGLLQGVPPAAGLMPAEAFVANLTRSMEDSTPSHLAWWDELRGWLLDRRVVRFGWIAVPVSLVLIHVFVQSVSLLNATFSLIPGFDSLLVNSFNALLPKMAGQLGIPWRAAYAGLVGYNIGEWGLFSSLVITAAIGLVYLAWIVGWLSNEWAAQKRSILN